MNPTFDWHEELYQLLIGMTDDPLDEGVRVLADIAAYNPEAHQKHLAAIQGGHDAALSGDESVVEVVNEGNVHAVADLPETLAFLKELRDLYLSHYEKALERKRAREETP